MHVPAVSPRELTGTTALKRGIPPGAPGRYTNTGHGEFVGVDKQKVVVALVQSLELLAPAVGACKSHSSNIVDVLSGLLDKAQTEFDDTCHAESNAAHNFSISSWT